MPGGHCDREDIPDIWPLPQGPHHVHWHLDRWVTLPHPLNGQPWPFYYKGLHICWKSWHISIYASTSAKNTAPIPYEPLHLPKVQPHSLISLFICTGVATPYLLKVQLLYIHFPVWDYSSAKRAATCPYELPPLLKVQSDLQKSLNIFNKCSHISTWASTSAKSATSFPYESPHLLNVQPHFHISLYIC